MAVLDGINRRGKNQLFLQAVASITFAMRRQMLSPDYTTDWRSIPIATINNYRRRTGPNPQPAGRNKFRHGFAVFGKSRFLCIKDHLNYVYCTNTYVRLAVNLPTPETHDELQRAYDFFNEKLFSNELPPCLITLQREKKRMAIVPLLFRRP